MSSRLWICALCGAETVPGSECMACGGEPRLLGRFTLKERQAGDGRGALYLGEDEGGAPVRVRIVSLPAGDSTIPSAWEAAGRAWQRLATAGIAAPLGFGLVGGGRYARIEAVVEGKPVRKGVGVTATLAALERLLDILAALHGAGVAHGGITPDALIRRADGLLLLTDFAPAPADPADDLAAVARVARELTSESLPPSIASLLGRLEGDRKARPSAAEAREVVHQARAARPATSPGFALPPATPAAPRIRPGLVALLLLAIAGGTWFWWARLSRPGVWEGSLAGRVERTEGQAPVRAGAHCTIDITAADQGQENCRIEVVCNDVEVFGGGEYGLAKCAGVPPRAEDPELATEDGDPALELAADQRMLRIWDQRHVGWQVWVRLEEF